MTAIKIANQLVAPAAQPEELHLYSALILANESIVCRAANLSEVARRYFMSFDVLLAIAKPRLCTRRAMEAIAERALSALYSIRSNRADLDMVSLGSFSDLDDDIKDIARRGREHETNAANRAAERRAHGAVLGVGPSRPRGSQHRKAKISS